MSKNEKQNEPAVAAAAEAQQVNAPAAEAQEPEIVPEEKTDDKAVEEPESYTLSKEEFLKVQAHIESLVKDKSEAIALLQRNQADFDNYRKRNNSIRAESFEDGRRAVMKELLPVLDNFDRAMEADASSAGAWQDGIKMVHRQFLDALTKLGLEEIPSEGAFDPNVHNAVLSEKVEDKNSGEILLVLQKGYRMGDSIIRHSMVKVAE